MTITLNTKTIVLLVATLGVLIGFAVSQLALSNAGPRALVVKDPQSLTQLRAINTELAAQGDAIDQMKDDTDDMCDEITGSSARCYP